MFHTPWALYGRVQRAGGRFALLAYWGPPTSTSTAVAAQGSLRRPQGPVPFHCIGTTQPHALQRTAENWPAHRHPLMNICCGIFVELALKPWTCTPPIGNPPRYIGFSSFVFFPSNASVSCLRSKSAIIAEVLLDSNASILSPCCGFSNLLAGDIGMVGALRTGDAAPSGSEKVESKAITVGADRERLLFFSLIAHAGSLTGSRFAGFRLAPDGGVWLFRDFRWFFGRLR